MAQPHVLFVTQHYPPEVAATGQLLAELAQDLVTQGFQVTVLAGQPSYGANGPGAPTRRHYSDNGVEVIRVRSTGFRRTFALGRAANWLSYPLASLIRGTFGLRRPDIVVAYTAPPTALPVGYLLARRWRSRLVLYLQDIYPDIAQAVGALRVPFVARAWRAVNRSIYRRADLVLVLGEHMAAHIQNSRKPLERITVVHNWADGAKLYPAPSNGSPVRTAMGLGDRFVVLYSGNLGAAHDFRPVFDALIQLRECDGRLAFVFAGEGIRRSQVERFVHQEGLEKLVRFRGYVPQQELLSSLSMGDASLLTVLEGTEGLVVPSKLYAYLATGRPLLVVCQHPCEAADIVRGARCGFVVSTGEELAAAVKALMASPDLRREMGDQARAVFEQRFERHRATERIGQILKSLDSARSG